MTQSVQRLLNSLRRQGVGGTVAKAIGTLPEKLFDRRYGTDTCGLSTLDELTIDSANRAHGTRYEPTRVLSLRKLMPIIRSLTPPASVLVDLGSGKGRVLLLAAEAGFQKLRGVEFAAELCDIARRNCQTFKTKTGVTATFEIIHGDVTTYEIAPDENVFFLFNPFDVVIFDRALSAIVDSWTMAPRQILIVICLPTSEYRQAIVSKPQITLVRQVRSWGYDFYLYGFTSRPGALPNPS